MAPLRPAPTETAGRPGSGSPGRPANDDPHTASANSARWKSSVNLLAGIWLLFAPTVLNYSAITQAAWNDRIVGVLILLFALVRVIRPGSLAVLSWLNALLGVWLIIAPFLLVYGTATLLDPGAARGNDVVVGLLVLIMGLWSARSTTRLGGGGHAGQVGVTTSEHAGKVER
jgi:hypothetical protein